MEKPLQESTVINKTLSFRVLSYKGAIHYIFFTTQMVMTFFLFLINFIA